MKKRRTPPSQQATARAATRASEHFSRAIERVTSLDEAWRLVLSGPRGTEPGAERYVRLAHFLKHLSAPPAATRDDRESYVALIRRFLKASMMDESVGKRTIALLLEVDRRWAK